MFSPFLLFEFLKNLFKCSVSSGIWGSPSWARRCSSKVRTPPLYDTHSGWRPIVNLRADPVNSVINLGAHKYLLCVAIDCSQRSAISSYSWYEEESPSHIGTPSFDFSTWRCRSRHRSVDGTPAVNSFSLDLRLNRPPMAGSATVKADDLLRPLWH